MSKKVLIGLSWPYANGRLHIGHVASSLPADVLARYHRMAGNDVSFVTGSDCYGTPILVAAKQEGITPKQLSDKYHKFHAKDFKSLGFTFSLYSKTTAKHHNDFVRDFHARMYLRDKKFIYEQGAEQLYCESCDKYLPDRYVEGICPFCKGESKGDSCDGCGKMIEPEELLEPKCKLCAGKPIPRMTRQLYLKLATLEDRIREYFNARKESWANNAIGLTGRYLNEGLIDRAITRNIEWGVQLPKEESKQAFNFSDAELKQKKIYIWAENVLGYLSVTKEWCERTGRDWREFLLDNVKSEKLHYYVHGKDNIPFHAIILPGLLMAGDGEYHLPDQIVSSEYVTMANDKMSKSKGNIIRAEDLVKTFDVDLIRYFFIRNVNDRKDVNFTLEDFCATINADLVNSFGNLVNRTLSFIKTKFNGRLVTGKRCSAVEQEIANTYMEVGELIEKGKTNKALHRAMDLVHFANKYFDACEPWKTVKNDVEKCKSDLMDVINIIANLARVLYPFVPGACTKVAKWLKIVANEWRPIFIENELKLGKFDVLFNRLDVKLVQI
ncbi:MAG: methionine--tRNA ligase [Firmicutes bacterium]|nr:methionine--tRNA ligase [Bacillota bacterium]